MERDNRQMTVKTQRRDRMRGSRSFVKKEQWIRKGPQAAAAVSTEHASHIFICLIVVNYSSSIYDKRVALFLFV